MKRLNLIFVFILVTNIFSSKAQNLQNLDAKYGFNKFKLESSINLYKGYLTSLSKQDEKIKFYTYNKGDIKTIFDYEIEKIVLGYYKGKLYEISIQFKTTDWFHSDIIYDRLKMLFGSGEYSTNYNKGPLNYDWGYKWYTNKTYLSFDKQKTEPASIWMISTILDIQIANDEF